MTAPLECGDLSPLSFFAGYPVASTPIANPVGRGPKKAMTSPRTPKGIRDDGELYSPGTIVDPSSRIASMLR